MSNQSSISTTTQICSTVWLALVIASFIRFNWLQGTTWFGIVIGFIFGGIIYYCHGERESADIIFDGEICVIMFYPIFVLKLMYGVDKYIFLKTLPQVMLISLTGFLFMLASTGFSVSYILGAELSMMVILVTGLSFTIYDVPLLNNEIDSVKNLSYICEGEAILSVILVTITHQLVVGIENDFINMWYHVILLYVRYVSMSILVGYCCGRTGFILKTFIDDILGGVIAYISCAYLIYILCECIIYCNGVIACVIYSIYISKERPGHTAELDSEMKMFINKFFDMIHSIMIVAVSMYLTYFSFQKMSLKTIVMAVSIYVISRVIRLFFLLQITPLLRRMGYGFDFSSYIGILCATRNGLGLLISMLVLIKSTILCKQNISMNSVSCIYALMSYIINGSVITRILRGYSLLEISTSRKINISAGLASIIEKRTRMLSILKMNRFFSDANWPQISTYTKFINPFYAQIDNDETYIYGVRQMQCTNCYYQLYVEPTKKEFREMSRDAHYRLLKAIRSALSKQYDHGILEYREIRALRQYVETALDSNEYFIRLDHIFKLFNTSKIMDYFKFIIIKLHTYEILDKPKQRCRAICFEIFNNLYFKIFMTILIVVQFCINVMYLILKVKCCLEWMTYINLFSDIMYILEIIVKVFGYSSNTIKKGFLQYFRNHLNKFDAITLALSFSLSTMTIFHHVDHTANFARVIVLIKLFRLTRITRIAKTLELLDFLYPKLIDMFENKIDEQISYAFTMGMAIIIAYEDTVEQLEVMIENPYIRKNMKAKLESDKIILIEYLGTTVRKRPWIAIRVETKRAVYAVLKQAHLGINDLKTSGNIDEFEFEQLRRCLNQHYKSIDTFKYGQFVPPRQIFSEIPYLSGDKDTTKFLYEHVATKIWNAGDVICSPGDIIEGVYILISGMFKVTYMPDSRSMYRLTKEGLLPIKDYLINTRFHEEQVEYIMVGSSIGELCVLTGREYSCSIISHTSSQAFIISRNDIWQAIENSSDPVNGFAPRIWKHLSANLVKRLLRNIPIYRTMSDDQLSYILERSVVPELGAYKTMVLSDLVQDIILVEGFLIDNNTRETYIAPCYIPRNVQNASLPRNGNIIVSSKIETRIWIIPSLHADEYELMLKMEQHSEISRHVPERLLLTKFKKFYQARKRRSVFYTNAKPSFIAKTSQTVMTFPRVESDRF